MGYDLDPLGARSPDELIDRCREAAFGVSGRLEQGDPADPGMMMAMESGLATEDFDDEDLQAFRDWRPPMDATAGSVYLDSTTVVTASRLLDGERNWLTPLTLWDLATVAQRVVVCDRVYYSGAEYVAPDRLNGLLGDDVFVSVPRLDEHAEVGPARVYGDRLGAYADLIAPLMFRRSLPPGSYWADAVDGVTEAWSVVTGHQVRPEDAMVPCEANGWFTPKVKLLRDTYCEDLALSGPEYCKPVLGDVTFRAFASQCFAELLGVPYAPALVRMPFRYRFCLRSRELEDRMRSVEAADVAYQELAGEGELVLPVFLAVALADARRPEDVWAALGDLRVRARPLRERRRELDEVLARGQASDDARRLLSAVRSEALKLTDLFGFGYELVAHVLGRVARATAPQLPGDVATLAGIARANLPADVRRRLWWWFFHPELRFLTQLRSQSRQMTNAMPQIGRVFGLPPSREPHFRRRFQQLAELRTAE